MADTPKIDEAAILEKANRGEALTPQEEEYVAGAPNLERSPEPAPKDGEEPEGDETPEWDETPEGEEEPGAETPAPTEGEEETPESEGAEPGEEEPPAEDPKPKPKDAKKPTDAGAAKETPEQRRELINAELEKADDKVDLSKFTPVEIGLYWDLKKQRRKNQALDQENRELRFKDIQRRIKERGQEAPEDETPGEDTPEDPLAGREDDDLLTVADVKKLLAGTKRPAAKKPAGQPALITPQDLRVQRLEANERLKTKGLTDFNDVVDHAEEALAGDEDARLELQETALNGGNVAEKTYWLIKGSKKWPEIEKKLKKPVAKPAAPGNGKPPEAKPEDIERGKRLKDNTGKIRTTGAPGGGGGNPGEFTEAEVAAMSPQAFGRLPKKTQDAILWKYGSDPNLDK